VFIYSIDDKLSWTALINKVPILAQTGTSGLLGRPVSRVYRGHRIESSTVFHKGVMSMLLTVPCLTPCRAIEYFVLPRVRYLGVAFALLLLSSLSISVQATNVGNATIPPAGSWRPIFLPQGSVTSLAIDPQNPDTIYATTGHLIVSRDGGLTWGSIGDNVPAAAAVAVAPDNSATIYVGTVFHGIFRSDDGGTIWSDAHLGSSDPYVFVLVINPQDPAIIYAGTSSGVFRSSDRGTTWEAVNVGLEIGYVSDLAINPQQPSTLYTTTQGGAVFRTTDGAASWQQIRAASDNWSRPAIEIHPQQPSTLYIGTGNGIFRSRDGGNTWEPVSEGLRSLYVTSLIIDPQTPTILYAGTGSVCRKDIGIQSTGLYRSANGGDSWHSINEQILDSSSLAINPVRTELIYSGSGYNYSGSANGVHRSDNGGDTWQLVVAEAVAPASITFDPRSPTSFYVGSGNTVWHTTNGGHSWRTLKLPPYQVIQVLRTHPTSLTTLYALTWENLFQSTDGGQTWASLREAQGVAFSAFELDPQTPGVLYVGTNGQGLYRSRDDGATWQSLENGLSDPDLTDIAVDPNSLYVATFHGAFRSDDGGDTWQLLNGLGPYSIDLIAVHPERSGTVYLYQYPGVYVSSDAGNTWNLLPLPEDVVTITALAIVPGEHTTIYVASYGDGIDPKGIYQFVEGEDNWTSINEGLASRVIHALGVVPHSSTVVYALGDTLDVRGTPPTFLPIIIR
jgi:photosystem II stability/assembly factor-like uncharacterized protein